MARIPYVTDETMPEEAREIFDKLAPLNLFRMMALSGGMLEKYIRLGNYFLRQGKLDPVIREIAILRVGYLSNASYETYQHERISRDLGMSDTLIAGIKEGPGAAVFDDTQRKVMQYVDDIVANVRASDATFDPVKELFSVAELQELTMVIGFYMMTCRYLETFGIDIEDTPVDTKVT
ncbi:MAG: carboxymuconolactone decarboxylase family protein [Alphaproteobacteria bacterium]|nr:MAG: carboxymuconolactone decarboxylase family protein [Alphaproteobacteria bacterium]